VAPSDFQALGLAPLEESVYRWLVRAGLSSLSEISRGARIALAQARSSIAALERLALVTKAPGRPARFMAAPPEIAMDALIADRQQALDQARIESRRLQEDFRRASEYRNPAELVEVIQGPQMLRENVDQMWRSTREEILAFDKPPYAIAPEENVTEGPLLASGVRIRGVYAREALERPGAIETLQKFAAAGEEARFFPRVPMKLSIFDRRVARIPLVEEGGTVQGAIVVHPSALLDALIALWETIWERSYPLPAGDDLPELPEGDALPLSEEDATLVTLLLAGSKSETIARQIGIGLSTVERRIKRLTITLGVETRFQAGYELARRGFHPLDSLASSK
jgi:transcriptional regulator TrmB